MKREAPRAPGSGAESEGPGVQKIPRQIAEHWWELMAPLPGQVLRPLRDATKRNLSKAHRRCRRNHARQRLSEYRRDMRAWMQSVDDMMTRHGAHLVDLADGEQTAKFHATLTDSERKALAKCQVVRAAIAYGEMSLEWLDWELSNG